MKHILFVGVVFLAEVSHHALGASPDGIVSSYAQDLDKKLAYGISLTQVKDLLTSLGVDACVGYTLGNLDILPEELGGTKTPILPSEAEKIEYCSIDLIEKLGIYLGFNSSMRLISVSRMHSAAVDKSSFGLSIAEAFSKLGPTGKASDPQVRPVEGGVDAPKTDGRATTKKAFISGVESKVKFGDDIKKVIQILKDQGVEARGRSLSLMTDEELAKVSEHFTDEERIASEYYEIDIENDIGMCFSFNYQKRLVRYERRWRYSPEMRGKTIADIESSKGSEALLEGSSGEKK